MHTEHLSQEQTYQQKLRFPTDADPAVARLVTEDLENRGLGWKLHLHFDPSDAAKLAAVNGFLGYLQEEGYVTAYKIGRNSGQDGKDATVYVGPRDKAEYAARAIASTLSPVLESPTGDALQNDRPIGEEDTMVVGRFDIGSYDHDFHQYGRDGIPYLNDDVRAALWSDMPTDDFASRAQALLVERYGTYFTGSEQGSGHSVV